MSFQLDLLSPTFQERSEAHDLSILGWNLQSPSLTRARAQMDYLAESQADVLVLSELKQTGALDHITTTLKRNGYAVACSEPTDGGEYCTLVCVRRFATKTVQPEDFAGNGRLCAARLDIAGSGLVVIGAYAPSYSAFADQQRTAEKRRFHERLTATASALCAGADEVCVVGDLNFIEPAHSPPLPLYKPWEPYYAGMVKAGFRDAYRHLHPGGQDHSWIARDGVGQRLDHVFVSARLLPKVLGCEYLHEPRKAKISDHSAMTLKLKLASAEAGP